MKPSHEQLRSLPLEVNPLDYLLLYLDVARAGVDPLAHYLSHRQKE